MAADEGKVDVVRLLTEAGAQLNIQSKVNVHIMDILFTLTGYTCTYTRCGDEMLVYMYGTHNRDHIITQCYYI